jgi:pyruvate/2-oxoglutarate dehydrogenase complex dihydrolipoamide acyltransferase (E2) component
MLKQVQVPQLGEQKQTETLLNMWYVDAGDKVKIGDDLAELVTDKAAFNLPSPESGRIVKLLVAEGAQVLPGDSLAEIETEA